MIARFIAKLLTRSGLRVSEIVLFGSHARGQAHESSDVDLAIVSGDFEGKTIFERAELMADTEIQTIRKFKVPLDLLMLSPGELEDEGSLAALHLRNGIVVYESH
jgi:uncharacterized protein